MTDNGWTLGDLAGELTVRGVDIENVPIEEIERTLRFSDVSTAAEKIRRNLYGEQ